MIAIIYGLRRESADLIRGTTAPTTSTSTISITIGTTIIVLISKMIRHIRNSGRVAMLGIHLLTLHLIDMKRDITKTITTSADSVHLATDTIHRPQKETSSNYQTEPRDVWKNKTSSIVKNKRQISDMLSILVLSL